MLSPDMLHERSATQIYMFQRDQPILERKYSNGGSNQMERSLAIQEFVGTETGRLRKKMSRWDIELYHRQSAHFGANQVNARYYCISIWNFNFFVMTE